MKEVKSPKKPLVYYYGIALLAILIFNMVVSPLLASARVKEVDYGTFMKMIEDKNIGTVEVDDSEIIFTDKDGEQIYKTGEMNDPTLTDRLYASGATFTRNIEKGMSPLLSFFLSFVLPILIFAALGQYMAKKMMSQAGGPNAMTFGMAIEAAKKGKRIARKGWNGKGQYVELAKAISYKSPTGAVVNAEHDAIGNQALAFVGTSGVQMGWLASQADMLADDWEIVEG